MNPIVVIATHQREGITCINIASLHKQTIPVKIVLVVSEASERTFFNHKYPDITVVTSPNKPLGNKWQVGVNKAIELGADPLIITGSDDLLDKMFAERACLWMSRNFDFIGLKSWYVFSDRLYQFKYLAPLPLGAGRVYSKRFLAEDSHLFEPKDRHLDDLGWNKVKFANIKRLLINDPILLSIKGNWPVMNRAETFFKSKNCEFQKVCDPMVMKTDFNYEYTTSEIL